MNWQVILKADEIYRQLWNQDLALIEKQIEQCQDPVYRWLLRVKFDSLKKDSLREM